ncbi:MAG: type IV pilus modification PilV family protein [Eubacteriaceae bacterium]
MIRNNKSLIEKEKIGKSLKNKMGYTLIETIVAIGICGFGLVAVLGFYTIGMTMERGSKDLLNQSLTINTIQSEIQNVLLDDKEGVLKSKVEIILEKYPEYTAEKMMVDPQSKIGRIEIVYQGFSKNRKSFFMVFYLEEKQS